MGVVYRARDTSSIAPSPSRFCHTRRSPMRRPPRTAFRPGGEGRERPQSSEHRHRPRHPDRMPASTSSSWSTRGGRTLDKVIPPKGLGIAEALRYAVQIADALATAHAAGIVHRDMKPSNIMVDQRGPRQGSRLRHREAPGPGRPRGRAATRTVAVTEAGIVLGTAAYMSPEQAEGRTVDARSDIFSFGAVLYEMLTGRQALHRATRACRCWRRFSTKTPRRRARSSASIPPDVERDDPAVPPQRSRPPLQTMADLKVALEDLAADSAAGLAAQRPAVANAATLALDLGLDRASRH